MHVLKALLPGLGLLAIAGPSQAAGPAQCLKGLRAALVAGDFSGSVDCRNDRLSVTHVGRVPSHGRTFEVYAYRYRLKPACPDCAAHGGQRIIFMENGRYIGQYRSDSARISIRKGRLTLVRTDLAHAAPVEVKFTAKGPAKVQWDGGEVLQLFR